MIFSSSVIKVFNGKTAVWTRVGSTQVYFFMDALYKKDHDASLIEAKHLRRYCILNKKKNILLNLYYAQLIFFFLIFNVFYFFKCGCEIRITGGGLLAKKLKICKMFQSVKIVEFSFEKCELTFKLSWRYLRLIFLPQLIII